MTPSATARSGPAAMAVVLVLLLAGGTFAQAPVPDRINVNSPYTTVAVPYVEDFEFGDGGFTAGGNDSWEHGEPTEHVVPVAGQGPNMWGTNLAGEYEDRRCDWVQSPEIDLSAFPPGAEGPLSTARLLFRHWMHFEDNWDGGVLQASANGVDWRVLTPVAGYGESIISSTVRECLGVERGEGVFTGPYGSTRPAGSVWRSDEFDLSAFLGGPVHLRWVMGSDSSRTRLGWYIDDIRIEVGAGVREHVEVPEAPDPQQGVPFSPLATVYAEDFEFDDGGWDATGTGAWEWGDAVAPPLPGPGSFSMWGTTLAGDYAPNQCANLTSPPIAIPGIDPEANAEAARLSFQMWRDTRSGYDGAVLQVSTDGGGSWVRVEPHDAYDRTIFSSTSAGVRDCLGVTTSDRVWSGPYSAPKDDEWFPVTVDLTPFMGNEVLLRFVFGSRDVQEERRGVYIDDVVVELGAATEVDATDPQEALVFAQPGWTVIGDAAWGWGIPSTGPLSSRPTWATNLHGDYGGNMCGAIVSPPIDTTAILGLGKLTLNFEHYFDTYSAYDAGTIQVSADNGATWRVVRPDGGYSGTVYSSATRGCVGDSQGFVNNPTGNAYRTEAVNVNGFDSSAFRVAFVFGSNGYSHDLGWYLRDVSLSRGAAALPISAEAPHEVLPVETWEEIAALVDEPLLGALKQDPWAERPAIVLGPERPDGIAAGHATRAEAMAHLRADAEPFFQRVAESARLHGGVVRHEFAAGPVASVTGDALFMAHLAMTTGARAAALDDEDSVHLIEPMPDESLGVQNTESRQMLQADEIWALGYRGAGVRISIIDTGIDGRHEAFKFADGSSRIVNFTDLVAGRTDPYDDHGHGTHVGGTAAGSNLYTDPTHGIFQEVGVAPEAELLGAKFLSSSGSGSLSNAIASLEWSFDNGADLTSNSWGSSSCSGGTAVIAVVHQLTDAGMLSVFAAGNRGPGSGTIGSPACGESALSVGAVDNNLNIAPFSSRGPCSDPYLDTPSRICPDVVAKGVQVRSAIPRDGASQADPSGYKSWQGTSMATPGVSGAVALAEHMKREITGSGWDTAARAEEQVLKLTALDLGPDGPDNTYGWGLPQLLNIHSLLESTDEARVLDTFSVSNPVLHQGDATQLSFSVRNLGGAYANGTFEVTLEDPNGVVTSLADRPISLGLLDQEGFADTFQVTSNVLHGTYTFRARFDYTWTNTTSGEVHSGLIDRVATFDVKRVFFDMGISGYPEQATPGFVQNVAVSATNAGNENATRVTFEFTIPDGYLFVPGDNYDPNDPMTRYADPRPDSVRADSTFGRITLVWERDHIPVGEAFSFSTNLLPTELGRQRALFVAKYHDCAGNAFSQGFAAAQEVALV